jgi:hypothetical protein
MTEQEWATCIDPNAMLEFVIRIRKSSQRKMRLFACACCRKIWHRLDDRSRKLVEVAEQWADGLLNRQQRRQILGHLGRTSQFGLARSWQFWGAASWACDTNAYGAARYSMTAIAQDLVDVARLNPNDAELLDTCGILRDMFGNLFRCIAIAPTWLVWHDRTVPRLAQTIYKDHAFDLLPILADALEEAGCTNADILNHCRQPGEHVRGCWVVDLLLGKS